MKVIPKIQQLLFGNHAPGEPVRYDDIKVRTSMPFNNVPYKGWVKAVEKFGYTTVLNVLKKIDRSNGRIS
jgi:hypothetical protein